MELTRLAPVPRTRSVLVCERDASRLVNAVNGGILSLAEDSVDKNENDVYLCIQETDNMVLEERDVRSTPEALSELTGRPPEDFEAPDGLPLPDLDDLETHDTDEFCSED